MSLNNSPKRIVSRQRAGLSLVELLVALAIFVTIMGGVSALYSGAVRTVREGYKFIDNMETARSVLAALEDDLKDSFSAPQHGDSYQFYGRPEGFMYVGTLQSGRLGRVTYVLNPNASTEVFETVIVEPYGRARNRAESQVTRWAVDNGLDPSVTWNTFLGNFQASYPVPTLADGITPDLEAPTEFFVAITTQALLRFEEEGVGDLSTFDLSRLPNGPGPSPAYGMQWPYVDPREPVFDDPNGDQSTTESAFEATLYAQILTALNPFAPQNLAFASDLREVIRVAAFTQGVSLSAVGPALTTELIEAKRRDIYLSMLAEDTTTGLPSFWNQGLVNDPRPQRRDYVIAEGILESARLLASDAGTFLDSLIPENNGFTASPLRVDLLDVPGMFTYGSELGTFNNLFNTVERVPGLEEYLASAAVLGAENVIEDFDDAITEFLSGPRLASATTGVPLTPRLPAMVQPGFWLMDEKATAGAVDFRRWFAQVIDVPAGTSRSLPARFVANNDKT